MPKKTAGFLTQILSIACLTASLQCCANSSQGRYAQTFDLATVQPIHKPPLHAHNVQLLITAPLALKSLDGQDILVKSTEQTLSYLPNVQWSDRLPNLIQAKLIEDLENTRLLKAVGQVGEGFSADYQLLTNIRAFNIVDGATQPQKALVRITAKLINAHTGNIKAQRLFTVTASVIEKDNAGYVWALNEAFKAFSQDLIYWLSHQF